jgi:hypothetical protein
VNFIIIIIIEILKEFIEFVEIKEVENEILDPKNLEPDFLATSLIIKI